MADLAVIRPQPGPQEQFLSTSADIAIYGGAAGGGKSFGLLLEPLRHVTRNPEFAAVFFRRSTVQVRNPGGLWDESVKLYGQVRGAQPVAHVLEWNFGEGGKVKFGHLEHDSTVLDWQGAQIPLIGFDELTHFSRAQFFYMLSRNRSTCGVRPYVRATCNPDADSWVAEFIAWWIDQDTGYAIAERAGVIRWFARIGDALMWGDTAEVLIEAYGPEAMPKSVTFIPASIQDNKALLAADPGYLANLNALPTVERERLKNGNWKIRPAAGLYFQADWVRWYEKRPVALRIYGASDYAVTDPEDTDVEPDFTEHGIFGVDADWNIFVLDWWFGQTESDKWIDAQLDLVQKWKPQIWFGEGGVIRRATEPLVRRMSRERDVFQVCRWLTSIADKTARARGFQARMSAGKVYWPKTDWARRALAQLDAFPVGRFDDVVDVVGLMGRGLDQLLAGEKPPGDKKKAPAPGSIEWLLQRTQDVKKVSKYRG